MDPVNRTAEDSSRRYETFVCIAKSACCKTFCLVSEISLFYSAFWLSFFSFVKPRAFCSSVAYKLFVAVVASESSDGLTLVILNPDFSGI